MIPFGPLPGIGKPAGSDGYVDLLGLDELPPASQKSVACGFQRVLLCRTDDGIHAVADLCPHALQPLCGGQIKGTTIRCARHGAVFDLVTGRPQNGVTTQPLRVYPLRVREDRIEVSVRPQT